MSVRSMPLSGGHRIPQFGFGTYKVAPEKAYDAVNSALEIGYRHIDTAAMYGNERGVGRAVAASGLPRDELFLTSKLDNSYHAPDAAREAFARTLDDLGVDVLDLYLIHWPLARTTDFVATWATLVELQASGRVRAVGVSNFTAAHLHAIIDATGVVPAVNQVEIHPYLAQEPLRALHRELGVVTQAWSPLARGRVLDDPVVVRVAQEAGCTPAQAVLAWHLRRGDVVFPKSTDPARMRENWESLQVRLSPSQADALSALDRGERSGSHPDDVELPD